MSDPSEVGKRTEADDAEASIALTESRVRRKSPHLPPPLRAGRQCSWVASAPVLNSVLTTALTGRSTGVPSPISSLLKVLAIGPAIRRVARLVSV